MRRTAGLWTTHWATRLAALATGLSLVACADLPPPRDPPLTADPPLGGSEGVEDAAVGTEVQRAVAYIKNDRYDEALKHLEKALASQPSNADALYYLGLSREKTGDKAGAEKAYKDALKAKPSLAEAAANLAAMYLDDPPRPDDAITVLTAALAGSPGDATLARNLAYAYTLKHDVPNASKQYDVAIAKGDSADLEFAYGSMLFENKLPEKAADHLRKALATLGEDAPTLVTVGRMLGSAKAFGDCVKAFDRALKVKATDPEWFVRRGTCKHEVKDEEGARGDFEAAVKVDPKFAPAHYYLGLSLLTEKKRGPAMAELEKAAKLGGDTPLGKTAKARFDELSRK